MSSNPAYSPLKAEEKEIRVLYLGDFVSGSPHGYEERCITGWLAHINLADERPPYYALSYVWGDPAPVSAVVLETGACIPIARNLFVALENIRRNEFMPVDVPIWVDAACINQCDDVEKSSQVGQMASIYSKAEKTIIFLGSANEGSNEIMAFFDAMGERAIEANVFAMEWWNYMVYHLKIVHTCERFPDRFGIQNAPWRLHNMDQMKSFNHTLEQIIGPPPDNGLPITSSKHVSSLLNQPWWTRVWVLQELLLSRSPSFVHGDRIVTAERVLASCMFLEGVTFYIHELRLARLRLPELRGLAPTLSNVAITAFNIPAVMLYRQRHIALGLNRHSLASILDGTRISSPVSLQTSNPVDQIYGLLGLVNTWPPERQPLLPDYSLSDIEVFSKVTIALLETQGFPEPSVLRTSTLPKAVFGLSSWVPDWSAKWDPSNVEPFRSRNEVTHKIPYQVTTDGRYLISISGNIYGVIQKFQVLQSISADFETDITMHHDKLNEVIMNHLSSLERIISAGTEAQNTTKQRISDVSIVVALSSWQRRDITMYLEYLMDLASNPQTSRTVQLSRVVESIENDAKSLSKILQHINQRRTRGKLEWAVLMEIARPFCANLDNTIFRANDAYVGLTQDTVREGDLIVRFDIDPLANFIVRPVGDQMHEIVARAFVPHLARNPSIKGQPIEFTLC